MKNVVIIGYGKLGSHLYRSLKQVKGIKVSVLFKKAKKKPSQGIINNSDIIFITTQDSKIKNAVKVLTGKQFDLTGKTVFHTSGSLTSDELKPLAERGAFTGSFHPVQTFESTTVKNKGRFKGIYIALEGSIKPVNEGKRLAKTLGSKTLTLTKENKPLHHICCVIASNFMASLVRQIEYIGIEINRNIKHKKIQNIGFKNLSFFNIYKPLAVQTLENISEKGAVKSLTGPIERNDLETINGHLKTLPGEFLPMYIFMGIETVKLSLEKKSISLSQAGKILKTFDKYIKINKIR